MKSYHLMQGNCLEVLKGLEDNSIDSVVTDPPYGLSEQPDMIKVLQAWMSGEEYLQGKGFMGKEWDSFVPGPALWKEVYRVLKPGGHIVAFSGSRTYDLTVLAIRLAGFEIRDMIAWIYGSGFPKSHDVSKAIDKHFNSEKKEIGRQMGKGGENVNRLSRGGLGDDETAKGCGAFGIGAKQIAKEIPVTAPATPEALQWDGWGTALKPSIEPVVLARKPLIGTVAENVLTHGTGALNIKASRIEYLSEKDKASATPQGACTSHDSGAIPNIGQSSERIEFERPEQLGRWPANLIHDGSPEVLAGFPTTKSAASKTDKPAYEGETGVTTFLRGHSNAGNQRADEGSAARFFYCSKTSKKDRQEGLGDEKNTHPTVKPTDLMRYLCKLITPPGGVILDPFMGSGSTGKGAVLEGFVFIGIDMDASYCEIAEKRIEAVLKDTEEVEPPPSLFDF